MINAVDNTFLWFTFTSIAGRCIADHMREARFPFLDEDVVTFLQQLPMDQKVGLIGYSMCVCVIVVCCSICNSCFIKPYLPGV